MTTVQFDHRRPKRISLAPYNINNLEVGYVPRPASVAQARELFGEILQSLRSRWRMAGNTAVIELE